MADMAAEAQDTVVAMAVTADTEPISTRALRLAYRERADVIRKEAA